MQRQAGVIQGAQSGEFLGEVERLLNGEEGFYDALYRDLGVPYQPVRGTSDVSPAGLGEGRDYREIRVETHDDNGEIVLAIMDNGPGIPKSIQERIFEPFFTTISSICKSKFRFAATISIKSATPGLNNREAIL